MGFKVTIIGSGNWGTAIARIVGSTVTKHGDEFDSTVNMWVFEEMVDGKKLSEIINTQHENVKYLAGVKLPPNVVAVPDLVKSAEGTDIFVFVVPHQFVNRICGQLNGKIKADAIGISLIKGVADAPEGGIKLITQEIHELLKIPVWALMGANLAPEVAADKFCEATIGCSDEKQAKMLKNLFQTDNFRINTVKDVHTVELCGALKNVVACAAGFSDGLQFGDNTKAAVIRIGLMEMQKFIEFFFPGSNQATYFESCGVADLITTCYGGRNRKVSEAFVKTGKSIEDLEKEMLNGQKLQGPETAVQVYKMLQKKSVENQYPLFSSVYKICKGEMKPMDMIEQLRKSQL